MPQRSPLSKRSFIQLCNLFGAVDLIGEKQTRTKKNTPSHPKKTPSKAPAQKQKKVIGQFIATLSIKPHYSATFYRYIPTQEETYNRWQPEKNTTNPDISLKSRSRLMAAINWMVLFSPRKFVYRKPPLKSFYFKVNFITLTLSDAQNHPDEWIKSHMLEPFLKWIRRSHNALNYVWRAESQNNGNIHFHITTNKYIPWKAVQNKWNQLQHDHGYLKRYFNIYSHFEAPSTDIKAVKNLRELAVYMGKYFAKSRPEIEKKSTTRQYPFMEDKYFDLQMMAICTGTQDNLRRAISGKQWACSTSLTKLSCCIYECDPDFWDARKQWINAYSKSIKKTDFADIHITNWNMNSKAPPIIARKIMELHARFNAGDDGKLKYIEPSNITMVQDLN